MPLLNEPLPLYNPRSLDVSNPPWVKIFDCSSLLCLCTLYHLINSLSALKFWIKKLPQQQTSFVLLHVFVHFRNNEAERCHVMWSRQVHYIKDHPKQERQWEWVFLWTLIRISIINHIFLLKRNFLLNELDLRIWCVYKVTLFRSGFYSDYVNIQCCEKVFAPFLVPDLFHIFHT